MANKQHEESYKPNALAGIDGWFGSEVLETFVTIFVFELVYFFMAYLIADGVNLWIGIIIFIFAILYVQLKKTAQFNEWRTTKD